MLAALVSGHWNWEATQVTSKCINGNRIIEYTELEVIQENHRVQILTLPSAIEELNCLSKSIIQMHLEHWQAWCHDQFLEKLLIVLDYSLSEEFFPATQSKPPLSQLETISCPFLSLVTDLHLTTDSFQAAVTASDITLFCIIYPFYTLLAQPALTGRTITQSGRKSNI